MQNWPLIDAVDICKDRRSFDILPLQLQWLVDNTCAQPNDWDGQKDHGQLHG